MWHRKVIIFPSSISSPVMLIDSRVKLGHALRFPAMTDSKPCDAFLPVENDVEAPVNSE